MSATEVELERPPSAREDNVLHLQTNERGTEVWETDSQTPGVDNATAVMTFWFNGFNYSWGVIQAALVPETSASASTLAFVGSVSGSFVVVLGLLAVRFVRYFGARVSGLLGTTLVTVGMVASGFTISNVGGLFGTVGVLIGTGASLNFMVASILPAQYFSSKVGLANGIVKFGGGVGGVVLSLALQSLIEKVGVPWTFRIMGILNFATGIPAAWVVKEKTPVRAPFVEWSLFRSLPFSAVFAAGATGTFALFVPPYYLPLFAQSIGLSAGTGAGIVAAFNACTAVGRFGSGYLCDIIGPVNTFFLTMLLNATSMLAIWPVSNTLGPLLVFAILNGVANGSFFTALPTVISSMFGATQGAVAMGLAVTGWTGGYLMGAPIAGYLLQASGGQKPGTIGPYRPAIFYAGGVAFASSLCVLLARLRMDKKLIKKL